MNAKMLNLLNVYVLIGAVTLICTLVFFFSRLALMLIFGLDTFSGAENVIASIAMAIRFDVAFVLRAHFIGVLLALLIFLVPGLAAKTTQVVWKINIALGVIVILVSLALSLSNISYVQFFDHPFDSFVFHGLEYGTDKVFESVLVLKDFFPALAVILVFGVLLTMALLTFAGQVERRSLKVTLRPGVFALILMTLFLTYVALGRGSLTTFPLSQKHLWVSPNVSLNALVPNAPIALYYGYQTYRASSELAQADEATGRRLFENFYGQAPRAGHVFDQFFTKTERSTELADDPPNVVLNLVESMGHGLLDKRAGGDLALAGALASHFSADTMFNNFLPAHNDTQLSTVGMLLNTEYQAISYSRHQHTPLRTSAARVFKQAGYDTVFVYAGFEGIKNRGEYYKRQGFDRFIGANQLKSDYPKMAVTVWGGEDRYAFKKVLDLLEARGNDDPPLMIVVLTVTNHPPYTLPDHGVGAPIALAPNFKSRLGNLPKTSLDTFFYTNNELGELIDKIKDQDLGAKTIIAVTGDHAVRGLRYPPAQILAQLMVPLYFYVPPKYWPAGATPSVAAWASHKDVMPTLYHLALSESRYPNLGRNLFGEGPENASHHFAYHSDYLVVDQFVYDLSSPHENQAPWALRGVALAPGNQGPPNDNFQSAKLYPKVLDWLTRYQLLEPTIGLQP